MSSKQLVVTISREHGSGGRQIAQEVARKLKLPYVDSQIIKSATIQLGIPAEELADFDEKVLPQLDEITKLVSRTRIGEHELSLSEALVPERDAFGIPRRHIATGPTVVSADPGLERKAAIHKGYHDLVAALIRDIAARGGAVILGRGAQFVLKNRAKTAHVHIFAPFAHRVQRLIQLQHISQVEAEQLIRQSDEQRAGYARRYYNADWRDPSLYQLILNTAHMPLPTAVTTIVEFGQSLASQRPEQEIHASYDRLEQESYSLKEASELLWISTDVLRQAVYRGELKVSVVDHKVGRISRSAILDWLRQRENQPV